MGGIQSPSSAGMPQTGIGQSGQQAGTDAGQAKAPAGSRGQSDRAKTDEQILADALGEFDKEAGAPQHGAATNPLPASSASGAGQGELTEAEKTQDGVLGPNRRKSALVSVDTRCCSEFVGG